jgi:hypothetical protein
MTYSIASIIRIATRENEKKTVAAVPYLFYKNNNK